MRARDFCGFFLLLNNTVSQEKQVMNPVVIIHFLAGVGAIAVAVPLIKGRVKMNEWYGVRIPAAFASEEAWLDINRFGGRLLLFWGIIVAATATVGAFLSKNAWLIYNFASLAIIMGSLIVIVARIYSYGRKKRG